MLYSCAKKPPPDQPGVTGQALCVVVRYVCAGVGVGAGVSVPNGSTPEQKCSSGLSTTQRLPASVRQLSSDWPSGGRRLNVCTVKRGIQRYSQGVLARTVVYYPRINNTQEYIYTSTPGTVRDIYPPIEVVHVMISSWQGANVGVHAGRSCACVRFH